MRRQYKVCPIGHVTVCPQCIVYSGRRHSYSYYSVKYTTCTYCQILNVVYLPLHEMHARGVFSQCVQTVAA